MAIQSYIQAFPAYGVDGNTLQAYTSAALTSATALLGDLSLTDTEVKFEITDNKIFIIVLK